MIRIIVIADVKLFRCALANTLAGEDDLIIVDEVSSGEVAASQLAVQADVAVIDLDARRSAAFAAVRVLHERMPECRILALTAKAAPDSMKRALRSEIQGIVSMDCDPKSLVSAIRAVAAGERFIEPGMAFAALSSSRNPLTVREMEVLRLVAEGLSATEVARTLFLTPGTVRNYLSAILRKLGARNRVEAVRVAQDSNWL